MSDLPKNWEYGKLSQAAHVVRGITFPAGEKRNDLAHGYVCCLRTTNVQQRLEWDDVYYVPTSYVKRDEQLVREGDVLMSMANSYELVGKVARAINVPQPAAFGAFLAAVRPTHAIDGGYLYHFLRSSNVQSKLREGSSQTTNIANISVGKLSELTVPLAPWNEQKRIADKLDTVLSRVDAVNTRLARVAPILKRFRQSVLAAATSGRLTVDWRNDSHPDVGDIPLNWKRTTLRHCITSMTGGASPSVEHYAPAGVLALNKGDIKLYGRLAEKQDQKRVPKEFAELHGTKLVQKGDLLVTLRDLSNKADFLGLIAQFMGTEVALPTQGMYALSVADNTLPKFLMYFSNSPIYREVMKREKVGATQVHLRNDQFLDIPLALPPVKEQAEIVRRVETLFAFADRLEARLQAAQTATERLTPALLAKAFRGELVPQDPNDEPASELLRRLEQEAPSTSTRRGRKSAV
ncbi:restriction endonuclease subunit S [Aquariibacter albus]|uniref:Restriction endonuclease subunit S n=1 Tax=Aquariibacter albus TaxID=2759899 RepID=A0A839HFC9_9BURK|nr:restriction endonuclease subunit S [Aquariibacter albus]MBB1160637.1 restriction endonuclease subunit S [Aquariibacter albus]